MRRNQMELALDATQAALADALEGLINSYGVLSIETWAPGDGWTRYRLMARCGSVKVGPYLRRSAMLDTLHVLRALAEQVSNLRREQNAKREEVTQ